MFLRLCTRAPCTETVVRAAVLVAVREAILRGPHINEGELLHFDVAFLGQMYAGGSFADKSLICEVLARQSNAAEGIVSLEVILDLDAGSLFAQIAEMVDDKPKENGGALRHVTFDRLQRRPNV